MRDAAERPAESQPAAVHSWPTHDPASNSGILGMQQSRLHAGNDMQDRDPSASLDPLPALDLLAGPVRRRIIWELAREPCTVTELARRIDQTQPLVSKHLRQLREAGLVEAGRTRNDARARVYEIRREPLIELQLWLRDLQQLWWKRTRHTSTDPDYYENDLDPNFTTRGTERIRTLRQLKDPWER